MDNSEVDDLLREATRAFERKPERKEEGMDADDEALVQLRKACRLLEAARFLRENDGYYTVVIETSFVAIERSLHFYLLNSTGMDGDEYVTHESLYERCLDANLYSEDMMERFLRLWRENRSKTYYRQAVGGEEQAESVYELAGAVHGFVVDYASKKHECVCS